MRIIDKNTDFYDYLQNPTDTIVFDRRGSFLLTKEMIADGCQYPAHDYSKSKYRFAVLQCGGTFWLFFLIMSDDYKDFAIETLATWENYEKPNELLQFDIISFKSWYSYRWYGNKKVEFPDLVKEKINDLVKAVDTNDYWEERNLSTMYICKSHKNEFVREKKEFPLLKATGISNIVDPMELFCAIEEYFSIEKTNTERTEAVGTTNTDKITMHGFDIKTSFRGKQS